MRRLRIFRQKLLAGFAMFELPRQEVAPIMQVGGQAIREAFSFDVRTCMFVVEFVSPRLCFVAAALAEIGCWPFVALPYVSPARVPRCRRSVGGGEAATPPTDFESLVDVCLSIASSNETFGETYSSPSAVPIWTFLT